jgi:DNA helicase-2/ATP-dependent DNA helicase PcrA
MSNGQFVTACGVLIRRAGDSEMVVEERDEISERNITGLRSGPPVDVTRTSVKNVIGIAVENATELLGAYPEGTIGVIAMEDEVEAVISDLMAAGWRRTHEKSVLGRDGRKIGVYRPVQARGLEFDGVVVVEPNAFPENLGRRGRLFTSLTRANQELRIVQSQGMPKELK